MYKLMNKLVAASLMCGFCAVAVAQTAALASSNVEVTNAVGGNLSAAERKKAEDLGNLLGASALDALRNGPKTEEYQKQAATIARKADDIASATMAQDRKQVLEFLGVNADGESGLYYFVSWSMPIEVLRSYAVEAMWAGGTLVFKGIPAGMDMKTYISNSLGDLVYGKGASASISIDPRLYDVYDVKVVPTIVYTEDRNQFACDSEVKRTLVVDKQEIPLYRCPTIDPSKFWKISGSITSDFALRQMIGAGAKGAEVHLNALAKGFATGETVPKLQQGFSGEWKSAITPSDLRAIKEATESMQLKQQSTAPAQ